MIKIKHTPAYNTGVHIRAPFILKHEGVYYMYGAICRHGLGFDVLERAKARLCSAR